MKSEGGEAKEVMITVALSQGVIDSEIARSSPRGRQAAEVSRGYEIGTGM